MKVEPSRKSEDYMTYTINPIELYSDIDELDTVKMLMREVAYQYYQSLNRIQKQKITQLAFHDVIKRMVDI